MGVCRECTVMIDGRAERACMTTVRDGLSISLRGPHAA
jgi:predicted molibdopterin-dependent oxidoreductase YjgC